MGCELPVGSDGDSAKYLPRRWLVIAAAVLVLASITYYFLVARGYNLDLSVYRSSVHWWWSGHDPYGRFYTVHRLAFTYPPFALVALSPIAAVPSAASSLLWFLINVFAIAGSFFIVFRSLKWRGSIDLWLVATILSCFAVFLVEPVRSTIDYGQINAVIMVACLYDMLWPTRRQRGVLVGVAAAIKLTPFIFVLFFAVKRDLRALCRAVIAFGAATGLAWLLLPGPSHEFWTKLAWDPERTGKLSYPGNLSWDAVIARMGLSPAGARYLWAGLVLVTLFVGAIAATRYVKAGSEAFAVLVVAITGLLISPVSWSHHWIWMVLIIPLLMSGNELNGRIRLVLGGLLLLVVLAPYWWFAPGLGAKLTEAVTPLWAFVFLVITCLIKPTSRAPAMKDRSERAVAQFASP